MQLVLSRNWTRIAVSISCDDNHYTTGSDRRQQKLLELKDIITDTNKLVHFSLLKWIEN